MNSFQFFTVLNIIYLQCSIKAQVSFISLSFYPNLRSEFYTAMRINTIDIILIFAFLLVRMVVMSLSGYRSSLELGETLPSLYILMLSIQLYLKCSDNKPTQTISRVSVIIQVNGWIVKIYEVDAHFIKRHIYREPGLLVSI